ncbi:hypothetical protein HYS47_01870 [Candidatus Woesearchaeota archaeon]|nr:hypothetical protein [Candidatus Woesearchaeota archaeon]
MKRKVVQVGPTTLMVSLPQKWAQLYGIQKGQEIDVIEEGNTLLLGASIQPKLKEITITIPSKEEYLGRLITAPYIKGYSMIHLKYKDSSVYSKILETIKLLIGFEIVESTLQSCTLSNISTTPEEKFDVLLRRLFANNVMFAKDLLSRIEKNEDVQDLMEYERNINRIHLFCRRVLQTNKASSMVYTPLSLYMIVLHLEECADCLKHIVTVLGNQQAAGQGKLQASTKELLLDCIRLQEILFRVFGKILNGENITGQLSLIHEHKKVRDKVMNNLQYYRGSALNSAICGRLLGLVDLSFHITEELFD